MHSRCATEQAVYTYVLEVMLALNLNVNYWSRFIILVLYTTTRPVVELSQQRLVQQGVCG